MNAYDNAEALLRTLAAPRRNQFFYGKRMDVQHFCMEQDYGRVKQSLINRLTLGKGVLCGLKVSIDEGGLSVDPGVAIDGLGREIVVPVRSAIDPAKADSSCCGGSVEVPAKGTSLYTLWACYRECSADYQPVLVADCNTREQCAPGTTVETFCFKITRGLAPLQIDPTWCSQAENQERALHASARQDDLDRFTAAVDAQNGPEAQALRDAISSLRHRLCVATASSGEVDEGDPAVPLAALLMRDGRPVAMENCLVRPRVYSNALLLELILCLAQRVDECCKDQPATALLRVASIDFLRRSGPGGETPLARIDSPLAPTRVRIGGNANAIRIRFSKPFAQDAHRPTTAGLGDAHFARHNVLVTPEEVLQNIPYVPGTLEVEAPDTLRFDLFVDSPYSRGPKLGWQKGRYRIRLFASDDAASGRHALTDVAGTPLDGEPTASTAGAISGDGAAGGDFIAIFIVG
jgi:hypothetical protein